MPHSAGPWLGVAQGSSAIVGLGRIIQIDSNLSRYIYCICVYIDTNRYELMCPVGQMIPVLEVASSFDGSIQLCVLVSFFLLRGVNNIVPKILPELTMIICMTTHRVQVFFVTGHAGQGKATS